MSDGKFVQNYLFNAEDHIVLHNLTEAKYVKVRYTVNFLVTKIISGEPSTVLSSKSNIEFRGVACF